MSGNAELIDAGVARIPPRFATSRRLHWAFAALVAVGAAAGATILFLFDPSHSGFYPVCLFHQTTGLLCPGCGSLRALHQLTHGHFMEALHDNALLMLSLPFFAWRALRGVIGLMANRHYPTRIPSSWLWAGFVVLLLFSILRNLLFYPFTALAP